MTNTQKLCKECEFFHIKYEPIKDVDFGQAECKKHNLVADFASHRLLNRLRCVEKGEPMDELISRRAVLYAINKTYEDTVKGIDRHSTVHGLISVVTGIYKNTICLLPPVQPERKKGKWIEYEQEFMLEEPLKTVQKTVRECSVCTAKIAGMVGIMNYCPNCGADMRGERDG